MTLRQTTAPWGRDEEYETHEEYWQAEVLAPLEAEYQRLVARDGEKMVRTTPE